MEVIFLTMTVLQFFIDISTLSSLRLFGKKSNQEFSFKLSHSFLVGTSKIVDWVRDTGLRIG